MNRLATTVMVAIIALAACKPERKQPAPAPSAAPDLEPRLASRYATPWGELGWQSRLYDTITFTSPGETVYLRCTVSNSPTVTCEWSQRNKFDPKNWDRGRARLTVHHGTAMSGTWGNAESDSDGGPCELKPLPR